MPILELKKPKKSPTRDFIYELFEFSRLLNGSVYFKNNSGYILYFDDKDFHYTLKNASINNLINNTKTNNRTIIQGTSSEIFDNTGVRIGWIDHTTSTFTWTATEARDRFSLLTSPRGGIPDFIINDRPNYPYLLRRYDEVGRRYILEWVECTFRNSGPSIRRISHIQDVIPSGRLYSESGSVIDIDTDMTETITQAGIDEESMWVERMPAIIRTTTTSSTGVNSNTYEVSALDAMGYS